MDEEVVSERKKERKDGDNCGIILPVPKQRRLPSKEGRRKGIFFISWKQKVI